MDDGSSIGFWKVAVGVLVAALFIGVIFLVARQGKSVANEKLEGVSGMLAEHQDEAYAMYDGMEVTGAEVRSVISNACTKGDYVAISVKTKAGTVKSYNYVYNSSTQELTKDSAQNDSNVEAADSTSVDYINPSAVFKGSITRNKNGVLVLLHFEQK